MGSGGGQDAATGGGDRGGEPAAGAGAGGGGRGGVTFVVTWDDGDQEDRVKTEAQAYTSHIFFLLRTSRTHVTHAHDDHAHIAPAYEQMCRRADTFSIAL
jgi:hypothetical protein